MPSSRLNRLSRNEISYGASVIVKLVLLRKEENILTDNLESVCNTMPAKSIHVNVPPVVMTWLRESSGYNIKEVSEKLEITEDYVKEWETGEREPTIDELRDLSNIFNRSLSAFYLPAPEKERESPEDYRKREPDKHEKFSKKTLLGLRKAQYFQEVSKELLENLDLPTNPDVEFINFSQTPNAEEIAKRERDSFQFPIEDQKELPDDTELFRELTRIIEKKRIFIFQFPMVTKELLGFTLMDMKPYAIVINSTDVPRSKIFTLMHEYGHILLHKPGICIPDAERIFLDSDVEVAKIEKWCNTFSGAFLMPREALSKDIQSLEVDHIRKLSNKYKVSQYAILVRASITGIINYDSFKKAETNLKQRGFPKDSGFRKAGTSIERAIRQKGKLFCSLVMQNVSSHNITDSTALDYLEIKLKSMDKLQKLL